MRKKVKYDITKYGKTKTFHFSGIGEIDEENVKAVGSKKERISTYIIAFKNSLQKAYKEEDEKNPRRFPYYGPCLRRK